MVDWCGLINGVFAICLIINIFGAFVCIYAQLKALNSVLMTLFSLNLTSA